METTIIKTAKSILVPFEKNAEKFHTAFSVVHVTKELRKNGIKTELKALLASPVTLAQIRKYVSADALLDYIKYWLINLNEFMFRDESKMMNSQQADQVAEMIIDDFYYFNIAEIALCFKKIKAGKLQKMYGELTGQYIIECFEIYRRNRQVAINKKQDIELNDSKETYAESEEFIAWTEKLSKKFVKS